MDCLRDFLWGNGPGNRGQQAQIKRRKKMSFKERLGFSEFTDKRGLIWKACAAEIVGNLLLNFFGCASCLQIDDPTSTTDLVRIALTFGFVIFITVQAFCHVSGAHLNPAVTLPMLLCGKISLLRSILYVCSQCIGAVCGSAILKAMTPADSEVQGNLGLTTINNQITTLQGLGVEFLLGFVLVLVVFSVCDPHRNPFSISAPLAIGMAVAAGHLGAVELTGASMNPARTFGSAVIADVWSDHWVYWLGPILGGCAAGILYQFVFSARPEIYDAVNVTEDQAPQKSSSSP